MNTTEQKVQKLEDSVGEIKLELVSISHAITDQANILKELKEVIVQQNKTLNSMYELKGKLDGVQNELSELQEDYRIRKERTDVFIKEGQGFMERWRGGLAVAVFCFASVQGIIGYSLYSVSDRINQTSKEVRKVEIEVIRSTAKSDATKETLNKLLIQNKNRN